MVELIIENEQNKEAFTNELEAVVRAVCEKVMECEECDFDAQISLTLTDNENIKIINNEFRSIDAPTDVLSFPMLEFDEEGQIIDNEFEYDNDLIMLGDIVISLERAREQSIEFGHSFKREIAFLCAHSMLHLLGYDHISENEERIMIEKQENVLNSLNITRKGH